MRIIPKTLLGRTALLLGLLMLISQAVWFACLVSFVINPIRDGYAGQMAAVVELAQENIERRQAAASSPEAVVFPYRPVSAFQIVSDSEAHPKLYPSRWVISQIATILRKKFGPAIDIRTAGDSSILWVRFAVKNDLYWVVIPKGEPPPIGLVAIPMGLGVTVSVAGAYLIIFGLTRQLREVTSAAQAVGRGEAVAPLKETGAEEILNLRRGFNQMASDLKKLDRDRILMLAGISHDLKTPLTRLRLAVELGETQVERQLTEGMVSDIEDMNSILSQFLDYARDGSEEEPLMADFNAIARDVAERYQKLGVQLTTEFHEPLRFHFRKLAIHRAITNLVDNAVRYGREGVTIVTAVKGEHAVLIVSDRGPGIVTGTPEDFIKPFARENTSRTTIGTGLGLTIVDRIVRTHGGVVHIANQAPHGLVVRIELPLVARL